MLKSVIGCVLGFSLLVGSNAKNLPTPDHVGTEEANYEVYDVLKEEYSAEETRRFEGETTEVFIGGKSVMLIMDSKDGSVRTADNPASLYVVTTVFAIPVFGLVNNERTTGDTRLIARGTYTEVGRIGVKVAARREPGMASFTYTTRGGRMINEMTVTYTATSRLPSVIETKKWYDEKLVEHIRKTKKRKTWKTTVFQ